MITRHSHPKARPELPVPPPAPTGINYLHLVAEADQTRVGAAVNYAALTSVTDASTGDGVGGAQPHPDQLDILDLLAEQPTHQPAARAGVR